MQLGTVERNYVIIVKDMILPILPINKKVYQRKKFKQIKILLLKYHRETRWE